MLQPMESKLRYVVVRLCFGNNIQYVGRVKTVKDFMDYREFSCYEKSSLLLQDWNPESKKAS